MNIFSHLLRVLAVCVWLAATVNSHGVFANQSFSPEIMEPTSFVYDGRTEGESAYDDWLPTAASTYDAVSVLPTAEERTGLVRSAHANRTPPAFLLRFVEFVAAETTAAQLEFPFARGASVQTPGVTTAGETFVRVGAGPQNLKFGSTSLK